MIGQGVRERDIEAILLDEQQIQAGVAALAERISADYWGRDLLLVGVLKGP
jgi:hypoxanthine phosphoribosyltransferase